MGLRKSRGTCEGLTLEDSSWRVAHSHYSFRFLLYSFYLLVVEQILAQTRRSATIQTRPPTSPRDWDLSRCYFPEGGFHIVRRHYLVVVAFSTLLANFKWSSERNQQLYHQRYQQCQNIAGVFGLWVGWSQRRMACITSTNRRTPALLS